MKSFMIRGQNATSHIRLGASFQHLDQYIGKRPAAIVTDETVYRLYHDLMPSKNIVVLESGETFKTLQTVETVYQKFLEYGLDRAALIIAIGGGIVCDIAGFAASTYLRGISFGFVPTTLLAQVDASVGGKNGVNFHGYKNLIGTFNQPEFVLIDVGVLKTLPAKMLSCGFAEAIKHGAIADAQLFAFMEEHAAAIRNLDPDSLERIVSDSIILKSSIVSQDEKEHGERRKLNFGHTVGHAVENVLGIPHGEAVAIGMAAAARLSQEFGYLTQAEVERLTNLLSLYGLPITIDTTDRQALKQALHKDKKRYEDVVKFVLLKAIGTAIVQDVPIAELERVIEMF